MAGQRVTRPDQDGSAVESDRPAGDDVRFVQRELHEYEVQFAGPQQPERLPDVVGHVAHPLLLVPGRGDDLPGLVGRAVDSDAERAGDGGGRGFRHFGSPGRRQSGVCPELVGIAAVGVHAQGRVGRGQFRQAWYRTQGQAVAGSDRAVDDRLGQQVSEVDQCVGDGEVLRGEVQVAVDRLTAGVPCRARDVDGDGPPGRQRTSSAERLQQPAQTGRGLVRQRPGPGCRPVGGDVREGEPRAQVVGTPGQVDGPGQGAAPGVGLLRRQGQHERAGLRRPGGEPEVADDGDRRHPAGAAERGVVLDPLLRREQGVRGDRVHAGRQVGACGPEALARNGQQQVRGKGHRYTVERRSRSMVGRARAVRDEVSR